MQGPNAVLTTVTYPPGALPGQERIVIDGVRAAIFEYGAGATISDTQADNPLLSSWAAMAGTDPFGNGYPQGFLASAGSVFRGSNFQLSDQGFFFYSGTPAFGNPPIYWLTTGTADPYLNEVSAAQGSTTIPSLWYAPKVKAGSVSLTTPNITLAAPLVTPPGTRAMYDATYSGWQTLQLTVPNPTILAYGPAWTSAQIATIPSGTFKVPIDNTGTNPSTTLVGDVENGDITTASVCASWINGRLARHAYAISRPTLYMNINGSYYKGAASDVITPLANTYNLHVGTDYDLWLADTTGTLPGSPILTNGVPCIATQYRNYTQNGAQYDTDICWDSTWNPIL